jgi:biotin operon repressor
MPQVMHDATSKRRVLETLRGGGWMSPIDIARNAHIQHNTTLKNIKFLRDDGYVIDKKRVEVPKGSDYYVYRLEEGKASIPVLPAPIKPIAEKTGLDGRERTDADLKACKTMAGSELAEMIDRRLLGYPDGHPDRAKAEAQKNKLKKT